MSKTLLIDDFRTLTVDYIARNFSDGITALKSGPWDMLFLDHDLGEDYPNDGYGVAKFLELHPEFLPTKIQIVSSNPVGRKNIERVLEKFYDLHGGIWIKKEE